MGERFHKLLAADAARTDLTSSAKILVAVIGHRVGAKGFAWPGTRTLARDTGTDRGTVLEGIRQLEAAGLLAVERRGVGKVNHYRLLTGGKNQPVGFPDRLKNTTRGGRKIRPEPVGKTHQTEREPLKRVKGARRKAAAPDSRVAEFITWFATEYGEAQGRKYVVSGGKDGALIKALLARLAGNGHDPMILLQQAAKRMLADDWGRPRASVGLLSSQINNWLGTGGRRGRRGGLFVPTDPKAGELRPDHDYSGAKATAK